jgi:transcriptional regulator with XRE-family HTH domain
MTKLKELRMSRGLRQLDVSFALKVSVNTIAGVERGQLAAPKHLIDPLCEFFGVQRAELFSDNRIAM